MSIARLSQIGVGYSRKMDGISSQAANPKLIEDPAALIVFQQQLYYAQSGYQLTSRVMQDMHREDQLLSEMLRDA